MASLLVMGGSNFRGNFSMFQLHPRRFVPDPPPAPVIARSSKDLLPGTERSSLHTSIVPPEAHSMTQSNDVHVRPVYVSHSIGQTASSAGVSCLENRQQKADGNGPMTWSGTVLRDLSNHMKNSKKDSIIQVGNDHRWNGVPSHMDSLSTSESYGCDYRASRYYQEQCRKDSRPTYQPSLCSYGGNEHSKNPSVQPVSYAQTVRHRQEQDQPAHQYKPRYVPPQTATQRHEPSVQKRSRHFLSSHRSNTSLNKSNSTPRSNTYGEHSTLHRPVNAVTHRENYNASFRPVPNKQVRCGHRSSLTRGVCGVCPADGRRLTTVDAGSLQGGGDLAMSMPDLRRETVVLSSQHTPAKNIPIIDDDDETNIDDEEDFFPAFLKNKLPVVSAESDRSSSDHEDRRRKRQSDPLGRKSGGGDPRRWGSRISLGNEDKTASNSLDFDDTDDVDSWSETTEVIYPPSEPESVDTYASTFQVFASDGGRKTAKRTSNINVDEDSEGTDRVSLEDQDDEDGNEETLPTSSASTPSDPDRDFMPRTPDKEQFLKENFESVSFTPVAMDKFAQQVATLERVAEISDPASMPFSPRLSLSSRFLSRSQFGAGRPGGGQRPDSWFDPLRKTKSEMARAMDETRRRLADMNWHSGGLLQESPEKEDPPSPPTKLDSKEPSFSTPKLPTSADLGGKLESDNSHIPSSPSRNLPTSPVRGANITAAKDKRRSTNGVRSTEANGTGTSSVPPPRQVPSYFRTTKSSRLKSSSSGSLLKQVEVQNNKAPANNVSSSKTEGPAKKRIGKGRLSSSRLAMYASTPNLTNFHEDKDEGEEEAKPEEKPSNLLSLAELSLSVPDIKCLDDPTSTDSSSSSGPLSRDTDKMGPERQGVLSSSRRSLPPGNIAARDLQGNMAKKGEEVLDFKLMPPPPPPTTAQPARSAQSSLLRRAGQARKRSTSELTLEQAKSILLGNSGILGTHQASVDEESPTSTESPEDHLMESVSSESTQDTLSTSASTTVSARSISSSSTLNLVSSRNNSSSSRNNSSSNVFDTTDTSGYTSANTLAVAEEIDRTANQLRRERERAAAAALDASRYDPPERDQSSPRKVLTAPVNSSRVTFSDSAADRDNAGSGDEDSQKLSVQERIALLNQHSPLHGSTENLRLSLEGGRSHSPSRLAVKGGRTSMSSPAPSEQPVSVQSPSPAEQRVSPRSQSDTGLGSDTDTDSDVRYHHLAQQSGDVAAARGDRSRLSLHLPESSLSSSQPTSSSLTSNEDSLRTCMSVVSDLKMAVERAKDFLSQVTRGNNGSATHQQQMTSMLSEAFREAHLTLAQLALQSPVVDEEGEATKPPSCPLVGEGAAEPLDSTVLDKARDMLRPFMSLLSRELSEELVKVIRDRLERGQPPP